MEHSKTPRFSWRCFIKDTLSDVDGSWSSKRVVTLIGVLLFCIAFFANTFWHFAIDGSIMSVLASIILSGLAVTAVERFGKQFPNNQLGQMGPGNPLGQANPLGPQS